MDTLGSAGLILQTPGIWCTNSPGRQSVAWATGALVALVGPLLDVSAPRRLTLPAETIVLRGADKTIIDYQDTAETTANREQVAVVNESLSRLDLRQFGKRVEIPVGRRIFNGSFDRGGRFYCHGASFQNMRSRDRRQLECMIDGVLHPMVEIDYSTLHPTMAYAEAGATMPEGDPYEIDGFDRRVVKIAVNIAFNGQNRRSAVLAVAKALHDDAALRAANGVEAQQRWWGHQTFTNRLLKAIEYKHRRIKDYFNSDCGARFQRRDSDMAIEVMTEMIHRTGRCPLPIHDSFLVADIDAGALRQTMKEVARHHGLTLKLKESRAVFTTIEDLIGAGSPLVHTDIADQDHQPPNATARCTGGIPQHRPGHHHPEVLAARDTPLDPSPAIQLEVTPSDLQGQERPDESDRPDHGSRKREIDTTTSLTGPTSPARAPNWHDPPTNRPTRRPFIGETAADSPQQPDLIELWELPSCSEESPSSQLHWAARRFTAATGTVPGAPGR
ncbi:hypothetical protein OG921_15860 [Aldersonia sp. NBC_00410]|uniref:hypothetical protein n=1 Tax=Aldersonia sp. NBC_00410 TaxID=2975954 RepID=UPI00224D5505|nr:hypothetical protein [Aldersonia sp. NBC_00410]MCX5044644.1 hypothetical protein [Aldersonia sp. NBC_00410]